MKRRFGRALALPLTLAQLALFIPASAFADSPAPSAPTAPANPAPPATPPAPPAAAAPPTESAKAEARDRFDRGLKLFNDGDNAGALAEFKRAYELIANPLVLFNVGLVYAAMNRPVEATDALDRVLKDPGSLSAERLTRAKQTRDEQAARVAELNVTTNVPATIEVDNVEAGKTPLSAPIKIAGGAHIVGAIASGYAPMRKEVTVAGQAKSDLTLELVEMQGKVAHLTVTTHLPAADVVVDGETVGKTPLATSLTLAPGQHKIEVKRAGYVTARNDMLLGDGASGEITVEPEEDTAALGAEGGKLALDLSETQGVVTVDGKLRGVYATPLTLARGVHRVRIERGGFETVDRDMTVNAGTTTTVSVALEPTPETRAAYVSKTTSQRTWGYIATIGGVAIAGGGVGYLIYNAGPKKDAQATYDAAASNVQAASDGSHNPNVDGTGQCQLKTGGDSQQCNLIRDNALTHLNSIKSRDIVGYVGAGVGAAALGVGIALLLTGDNPHKYDKKEGDLASGFPLVLPTVQIGQGRGAIGLVGTF